MEKRGDLSSKEILTIVLVLVGLVIVLIFIFKNADIIAPSAEACRFSILTRATAPSVAQGVLPLKCQTKKICINLEGAKCPEFAGDKNVFSAKLTGENDYEKALEIAEVTATALYDCWNMMGEGKFDLFGNYLKERGLAIEKNVCVICSRVAIAPDVPKELLDNPNIDVQEFMKNNYVPGTSMKYINAITNDKGVSSYNTKGDLYGNIKNFRPGAIRGDSEKLSSNSKEIAFVFSQIKSNDFLDNFLNLLGDTGIVSGGTFIVTPVNTLTKALFVIKNIKAFAIVTVAVAAAEGAFVGYNTWQSKIAVAGYCGELTTNDESNKKGCSMVQAVPYSASNINSICEQLEGSP